MLAYIYIRYNSYLNFKSQLASLTIQNLKFIWLKIKINHCAQSFSRIVKLIIIAINMVFFFKCAYYIIYEPLTYIIYFSYTQALLYRTYKFK